VCVVVQFAAQCIKELKTGQVLVRFDLRFYRASATQYADARYWYSKYVCLSVRPLRSGTRWKRLNISSYFCHRTV